MTARISYRGASPLELPYTLPPPRAELPRDCAGALASAGSPRDPVPRSVRVARSPCSLAAGSLVRRRPLLDRGRLTRGARLGDPALGPFAEGRERLLERMPL